MEEYITRYGIRELGLSGGTLSVFAEVVARTWISAVSKGPWAGAEPLPHYREARYEFDAISIERVEDRVEIHVAEVEVGCSKFLELENRKAVMRIEGK